MRVCFFAKGSDVGLLEDAAYYSEDISILRELGHTVVTATRFREIPWDCDLYFTWWYAWGFMTLCKSLPRRTPNVMVGPVHLRDPEVGFYKRPMLRQWSIRLSLHLADAAVAVSKTEYDGICALGARNPWMVYHSIVPPEEVKPLSQRKRLVLSIGHLDWFGIRRKRFDNLVRAIPFVLDKFPDTRFAMLGRKGPGFEKLLELARALRVQDVIAFPGRVDNATKSEYLQCASVLAQPTCYEGFGLAQLEAMASGLPVVTTPSGAVTEVVADCALYCDKDRPEELARRVISLLDDQALWEKLSASGRERALALFSREARKKSLGEIIASVTRRASTVTPLSSGFGKGRGSTPERIFLQ